jgi:hypothetical protein
MTYPANPAQRWPKGDHNRRLSLGIASDIFAAAAGITEEQLRAYEFTEPDGIFDPDIARRVGNALEMMEEVKPSVVDNGPTPSIEP